MNLRNRVRVKICGITRIEDALAAAELGVDAVGLVFAAGSSRCLSIQQAGQIAASLPPFISRIALVMDAEQAFVEQIVKQVEVDLLQFHGSEDEAYCCHTGVPYLKALSIDQTQNEAWRSAFPSARGFVIDSHAKGAAGGTGKTFAWDRFPALSISDNRPLILAGGLNIDNVATAISRCGPFAVDVSSGVESQPGIKDADLMNRFISEVNGASRS